MDVWPNVMVGEAYSVTCILGDGVPSVILIDSAAFWAGDGVVAGGLSLTWASAAKRLFLMESRGALDSDEESSQHKTSSCVAGVGVSLGGAFSVGEKNFLSVLVP